MSFQARVGSWFAAHILAGTPVGSRFGVEVTAHATAVRFESADGMDDVVVNLSTGGRLYLQCKTTINLSTAPDSSFAKVVNQLIDTLRISRDPKERLPSASVVAVLAVGPKASAALEELESVCRLFDYGDTFANVQAQTTVTQTSALKILMEHVERLWPVTFATVLSDDDRAALCRLLRVARFDINDKGPYRRESIAAISRHFFDGETEAEVAWPTVLTTVRALVQTGAGADREGFVQALVRAGVRVVPTTDLRSDVELLKQLTAKELRRLSRHAILPGTTAPIERECAEPLAEAIRGGSLLITGLPGAGKTGELVTLANRRVKDEQPTVFLSVDAMPDVRSAEEIGAKLGLKKSLIDVLKDWQCDAGVLFIDALDASRGGTSERAFVGLIEDALQSVANKWSVVASIRSFDLLNGKRFRELMAGSPPDPGFSDKQFSKVRHFQIPLLSSKELAALAPVSEDLARLVSGASGPVKALLCNIFNLSLAAQLLNDGKSPDAFQKVSTQSELIELYEEDRLGTHRLKLAVKAAVEKMVERQSLVIPQHVVENPDLDDVLKSGVLIRDGDRIGFAHHILFDHSAGRYFLDWADVDRLVVQLRTLKEAGFLLGPALQFALQRVWKSDGADRESSWRFVSEITSGSEVDPVLRSVAVRSITDCVEIEGDLGGLIARLKQPSDSNWKLFSTLSRFAVMGLEPKVAVLTQAKSKAWSRLALDVAATGQTRYADGIRVLLLALFERVDMTDGTVVSILGAAARQLLMLCWTDPANLDVITINAVRFVGKTYGTDPVASSALFERSFQEPHFSQYAHIELPWIAESAGTIAEYDPSFVAKLFEVAFTRSASRDQKTWVGGPSQIMGLTSTAAQDFDQARWLLKEAFPDILKAAPLDGTLALIRSVLGLATREGVELLTTADPRLFIKSGISILPDRFSYENWENPRNQSGDSAQEMLAAFAGYLEECSPVRFDEVVALVADNLSPSSLWNRILGIAAKRRDLDCRQIDGVLDDREFVEEIVWRREIVSLEGARYTSSDPQGRAEIERYFLGGLDQTDPERAQRWEDLSRRFFAVIDTKNLQTDDLAKVYERLTTGEQVLENGPLMSFRSWAGGSSEDTTAMLLRRQGADLSDEPNASLYAIRQEIDALLPPNGTMASSVVVEKLWRSTLEVGRVVKLSKKHEPHLEVLHAVFGSVSNAVEAIVKSEAFSPGENGHPSTAEVFDLISGLAVSPFPEPVADESNASMAWGNWDVRVYAAISLLHLIIRTGQADPRMLELALKLVRDPAPTVRLQLAQALNVWWDVAHDWMWRLTEEVARHETHPGVLGFFVSGPLGIMAYEAKERVATLALLNITEN